MTQTFLDQLRGKGLVVDMITATDPDEISFPDPKRIKMTISTELFKQIARESLLNLTLIPAENAIIGLVRVIRRRADKISINFDQHESGTPQLLSINPRSSQIISMISA